MTLDAEDQPLDVELVNGEIVMTGPRVAITLCRQAATETARRLMSAANEGEPITWSTPRIDRCASNDR